MSTKESGLNQGATLMLIGSLAFIGYAAVFLLRNFSGSGFELGVETLKGVTRANLDAINPAIVHYIGHVHVALAGFIAATGIAVAALSWYGVRRGEWWAWIAAVVSPVVGLIIAIPYHYMGHFGFNWVTHLGPLPCDCRVCRGRSTCPASYDAKSVKRIADSGSLCQCMSALDGGLNRSTQHFIFEGKDRV